jgi:hypothetical protein
VDQLVLASNIVRSKVEKENSPPYPKDAMMDSKKETTNLKDTMHYKKCVHMHQVISLDFERIHWF